MPPLPPDPTKDLTPRLLRLSYEGGDPLADSVGSFFWSCMILVAFSSELKDWFSLPDALIVVSSLSSFLKLTPICNCATTKKFCSQ